MTNDFANLTIGNDNLIAGSTNFDHRQNDEENPENSVRCFTSPCGSIPLTLEQTVQHYYEYQYQDPRGESSSTLPQVQEPPIYNDGVQNTPQNVWPTQRPSDEEVLQQVGRDVIWEPNAQTLPELQEWGVRPHAQLRGTPNSREILNPSERFSFYIGANS